MTNTPGIVSCGLVVYAWLMWLFDGSLRQIISSFLFRREWLSGRPRDEIRTMSNTSFEEWVCLQSSCPASIRKLILCPYCMSFHVSLWWVVFISAFGAVSGVVDFSVKVFAGAGIGVIIRNLQK